jgi:carbon-monoxide dehydrogenase large subunit
VSPANGNGHHTRPDDKHLRAAPDYRATAGVGRFVGQRVARREDARLVTGRGRYVDDVVLPGMLHATFLRSNFARARVTRLDVSAARALDGVVAVFTGEDFRDLPPLAMTATMMHPPDPAMANPMAPPQHPLADGDVRYVGDPVALVVAENRYIAEDACELIDVDYEPLPPVVDYEAAAESSEKVHHELAGNVASTMEIPVDPSLQEIFDDAAHVVEATFRQHRQTNVPMETRGIVAHWNPGAHHLEIAMSNQNPHEIRRRAADLCGIPEHDVRVSQQDVGGGFGQKMFMPREEMVVTLAAFRLGRPVKWIEDRRENLMAANSARTERATVRLAFDADHRIVAAHIDHLEETGAYPFGGSGGTGAFVTSLFPGPYKIPRLAWKTATVYTNHPGRGAYRGPWMMETVAREEAIEYAARELGVDPLELRRKNVVRWDDLPYTTPMGMTYDIVTPSECLEQAVAMLDYEAFRREQAEAAEHGRYLGVGMGLYIEPSAMRMGPLASEAATVRVSGTGKVDVYLGSGSHGQSIETTMIQIVADELGIDIDDVVLHQGDTASTPFGGGTGGSRTAVISGGAMREASAMVRTKAIQIAAHLLEANPDDLDIADGQISVRGTPARAVAFRDVAAAAYYRPDTLPPGMELGLEATARYQPPPFTWSNACHVCTVEVDPTSGATRILRYIVSEDCGTMINPNVVEGQVAGGVVQGIGGVLYEHMLYDDDGNPLASTFMDYLIPTAGEVPVIEYGHVETPSNTPGGHKGMGEGGAIGAPPCVFNAVADALAQMGVTGVTDQPLGPREVLDALAAVGR